LAAVQEITSQDVVTFSDLEQLAHAGGPCVTIALQIPNPLEISTRFKNAIRTVEKRLAETVQEGEIAALTQPIRDLAQEAENAGLWASSMVLYRSRDLFRWFLLHQSAKETLAVEDRFQVRPLLSALAREQRFHLLALSRNNIRLFDCTHHRFEETPLGGLAPQDIRVWMGTWKPDHVMNNRSAAGQVGSMKGVAFTTSGDRERENQYIAHFFADVDRGISPLLRRDDAPLVLAGVEEEVTIYRRVNTYPRLIEKAIQGAPDGIEDPVLHRNAAQIAGEQRSEGLEKTLARFARYRDKTRLLTDPLQILPAVWDARVSDFVFSGDAELRGVCSEETREIEERVDGEDLINLIALRTLLQGGQTFALRTDEMPAPSPVAAVLRF